MKFRPKSRKPKKRMIEMMAMSGAHGGKKGRRPSSARGSTSASRPGETPAEPTERALSPSGEGREVQSAASKRVRTCVGCAKEIDPAADDCVRLIVDPTDPKNPEVAVDARGSAFGRGAWVHTRGPCVERAARVGLSRSFRMTISKKPNELIETVREGLHRRIEGLLLSAKRSGRCHVGGDAVERADKFGPVFFVVATDARSAADRIEVRRAVSEGRAASFGTKEGLGLLFRAGTADVAVIGIEVSALSHTIQSAIEGMSALSVPGAATHSSAVILSESDADSGVTA